MPGRSGDALSLDLYELSAAQRSVPGLLCLPGLYPETTGQACPIDHKKLARRRLRPQNGHYGRRPAALPAHWESSAYKMLYNQRSATERVNSQAVELGIERPKLRNQRDITNQNTLTYVLINLRGYHRLRDRDT